MDKKIFQNKTEKEVTPTTLTTEKPVPNARPIARRRSRRRLPAW